MPLKIIFLLLQDCLLKVNQHLDFWNITLKKKPAIIIVIEDGTLDDIVKALIAKQQGQKFTKFQEIFHGKYILIDELYRNISKIKV